MKILTIADFHNRDFEVPEGSEGCDYLIVAGDLSNGGTVSELENAIDIVINKASILKIPKVIIVPGNHDNAFETELGLAGLQEYLHKKAKEFGLNAIITIDELIELYDGTTIFLSPYYSSIGKFFGFNYTVKMRDDLFKMIPKDVEILVTHGPAYGVLDSDIKNDWDEQVTHFGCPVLSKFLKESNIRIHIHGHIHEAVGEHLDENSGLLTFNVATKARIINF